MLCRGCDELVRAENARRGEAAPAPAWEPERTGATQGTQPVQAQLCTRCGHLLGTDDIVKRVRQKQSQLERFGLSGPRRLLVKPPDGEET